jgi:hypothetical protein
MSDQYDFVTGFDAIHDQAQPAKVLQGIAKGIDGYSIRQTPTSLFFGRRGSMTDKRKIFVGSSSEALGVAELVGKVIEDAGMEPVLWKTVFPAGDILLESIEKLPSLVDGAVLLATPDLDCHRKEKNERYRAPIENIVFEYGYLSARLSRKRVAICTFNGAKMPSDLQGLTLVPAGRYEKGAPSALPAEAKTSLERWLAGLAPLAAGISPISQVHGYSGTWNVQNKFSLWHGLELGPNDTVTFDGKALLWIRSDGEEGYGTQIGQMKVTLGQYQATWDIANEVIRAAVDKNGSLSMRVRVSARSVVEGTEKGTRPSERVREELPSREWDLVLEPVPGEPQVLKGAHTYRVATAVYSRATEVHEYMGV